MGLAAVALLESWRTQRWGWMVVAGVLGLATLWPSSTSPTLPVAALSALPDPTPLAQPPTTSSRLPLPPLTYTQLPTPAPPTSSTNRQSPPFNPTLLAIPALGVSTAVQEIPVVDGQWDVSALGAGVGRLGGLGERPLVLVGHMTFPLLNLLQEGAFAHLPEVRLGDVIWVTAGDIVEQYEVVAVGRLAPADVAHLLTAAPDTLLLLTCTDWNFETWQYDNRLVVTAQEVKSEK